MAVEIWGQEEETIGYCAFCPDWKISGPAREVAELMREHRKIEHPDLPPPTRRRRANLSGWRSAIREDESAEVQIERTRRMHLLGIKPQE